ncbi:MAG: NAD(P)-dependent glycerol-3-phosphate dehydrogenase [Oscillospiraceae bacterium]|jgi:glycerol-3-phosphate dehydrogenase (NAD(P)+)|nr:NAD(P)-dependent glycerol-3-phosphate dehydrogenase [Oscillospiraceae bacterium]
MVKDSITIIGAGSFGLALAVTFERQHAVNVWSFSEEEKQAILRDRENKERLPGVRIPESINITTNLAVAKDSELVIISVPSIAVRSTARLLKPHVDPDAIIVNVSKGIEQDGLRGMAQVISEELGNDVVIMCGPSHAEELAAKVQTSMVAASKDMHVAGRVAMMLEDELLQIYVSDDVCGLEIGSTFKNVIAIAVGICAGLNGGDNLAATVMTKGLCEIGQLGVAAGAKPQTFGGVAGLGDLIATCGSKHSRNRRFGMLVGSGVPVAEALKQVGMVVEGYHNAESAKRLMERYNLRLPVMNAVHDVLYNNKDASDLLNVLQEQKASRSECVWF